MARASGAREVLNNAQVFASIEEAVAGNSLDTYIVEHLYIGTYLSCGHVNTGTDAYILLEDCHMVFATTARLRDMTQKVLRSNLI